MKIRLLSDTHFEFLNYNTTNITNFDSLINFIIPPLTTDKKNTLVCAGDIGKFNDFITKYFINTMANRFKYVIFIPGNHEFYNTKGIWNNSYSSIKNLNLQNNVFYLDNNFIILNDILFIGSTLWTDCNNENPLSIFQINKNINDYKFIKKENGIQISPYDTIRKFKENLKFIDDTLHQYSNRKNVIITHHSPSYQSIHDLYKHSNINGAFSNDLDYYISNNNISFWLHGHNHNSSNYFIGNTKIISNPFGYLQQQNHEYNNSLIINI